jgi:hypothetical protein
MINYWWVTRPKRKLNSIPEVLSTFSELSLDEEWQGQRETHLSLEEALEESGLKRVGKRRDQQGGGARTYKSWLISLGLIFIQESTGKIKLTLAGESIMEGKPPVEVLKEQVLKYQFPSAYSIGRGVKVSSRFKIRPFRFLLRLLTDERINYYLTEEEIAKVVITQADKETEICYNKIVSKIINFRNFGDNSLENDFIEKYQSGKGGINPKYPYRHLIDTANTLVNWIEYTQLAKRNEEKKIEIVDDKQGEVLKILSIKPTFIDRPEEHEYFQRKYGVDPWHSKDTRNLTGTKTITSKIIAEQKIKQAFIGESLKRPIARITPEIVDKIVEQTGIKQSLVEELLLENYPHGAIGSFMTEYFEMAFKGRDEAIEFEKATAELFKTAFGFETKHVGATPLSPDVLILSNSEGFLGILDNKAYSRYSITNDHKNRMIHNYINKYQNYERNPLAFFSYIAGGFGKNITNQVKDIVKETKVHGSAISVSNVIKLVDYYDRKNYDHNKIKNIFSVDRQILVGDI